MIGSNLKTSAGAKQRITTIRGTEDLHELCVCTYIYDISSILYGMCERTHANDISFILF